MDNICSQCIPDRKPMTNSPAYHLNVQTDYDGATKTVRYDLKIATRLDPDHYGEGRTGDMEYYFLDGKEIGSYCMAGGIWVTLKRDWSKASLDGMVVMNQYNGNEFNDLYKAAK